LSPDGTKLVLSLGSFQGAQLYLRSLDRPELQLIPGTLDAFNPFFSPDGQWVGFFTTTDVKKAPVSGGPVVTICHSSNLIRGSAVWGSNGTIYFTPYSQSSGGAGVGSGVMSVPASGGEPVLVTTLASGERSHIDPVLLPGNHALLFTVIYGDVTSQSGANFQRASRIVLRSLDTGEQRTLIDGASFARYLPTGHILYMKSGAQGDALLAAPFDLRNLTLTGAPVVVSDQIASDGYSAQFSWSQDGTLAYLVRAVTDVRSLVWVDRHGNAESLAFGQRTFDTPRLSPDGTRVAAVVREKGQADVWVQERSGALSRLTFDGVQPGLIWTPAGNAITFSTLVDGKGAIVSQEVDGDRAAHVLRSSARGLWPGSWSRDGQTLAFMESTNAGDVNLLRTGDATPTPFVSSAATEWGARLSPDDRWMAYTSNESSRWEAYVKPYPGPGARRQISTGGGTEVVWARNGRELFYRNGTKLMGVDIQTTPTFSTGSPHVVIEGTFAPGPAWTPRLRRLDGRPALSHGQTRRRGGCAATDTHRHQLVRRAAASHHDRAVTASAAAWRERFSTFVARKEAEARAARLLPFTTDVDEDGNALDRIDDAWVSRLFDGPFYLSKPSGDRLPSTNLVFVQSRDGNTGAAGPVRARRRRHRQASDLRRTLARGRPTRSWPARKRFGADSCLLDVAYRVGRAACLAWFAAASDSNDRDPPRH
jgi:Tol biopolymer transport system component